MTTPAVPAPSDDPAYDSRDNKNLVPAEFEQHLRDNGGPIRCCPSWPECSHILEWYEKRGALS